MNVLISEDLLWFYVLNTKHPLKANEIRFNLLALKGLLVSHLAYHEIWLSNYTSSLWPVRFKVLFKACPSRQGST